MFSFFFFDKWLMDPECLSFDRTENNLLNTREGDCRHWRYYIGKNWLNVPVKHQDKKNQYGGFGHLLSSW